MRKDLPRPSLDPADALGGPRPGVDRILDTIDLDPTAPVLAPGDPSAVRAALSCPLPEDPTDLHELLEEIIPPLRTHARQNAHPGMFGYVCGPGLPTDPLAHALVAALGQNVTGFPSAPGATAVEHTLLRWLARRTGLPSTAGGVLVSGGSMANFTALVAALHQGLDRREGLARGVRPRIYVGPEAHFSIARAARLAGLGTESLVITDMSPNAVAAAIEADRHAGERPALVVGTAGSTGTGRIDPLGELADLCAAENLWFHVDAAYGGAVLLSDLLKPLLSGIERADSVTLDLHKWLYTTFDCSALLYRDPSRARAVFYEGADYIQIPRDPPPEQFAFFHLSPETSRRFRALAPYLALRHHGRKKLARNIEHNVACARYLGRRVAEEPALTLSRPVELAIVCFRVTPRDASPEECDAITRRVFTALEATREYYLSPGTIDGHPVLRVCICSHQTTARTLDAFLDRVLDLSLAA